MSKTKDSQSRIKHVTKRTCQGGKIKTSSLNKSVKKSFKAYRGQGR